MNIKTRLNREIVDDIIDTLECECLTGVDCSFCKALLIVDAHERFKIENDKIIITKSGQTIKSPL